jgi:tetratricopeptide (TPR) repeat protein
MVPTHGRRPRLFYVCVLLAVVTLAAKPCRAQSPADSFAAATRAFESGDYHRALELFQVAQADGLDSPALHYNLGVCQYRVGAYAEAAATFTRLRERFPEFAAVAEYNRGLAFLALDDLDAARTAFTRASNEGDATLSTLAASALATIEPTRTPAAWLGYFDVGAGYDDNIALVDELSLPANTSASSPFMELVGLASRSLEATPLRLDVSGYLVRYADEPQFDQQALRIDTAFYWSAADWRFEAGPHLGQTALDGDSFERGLGATLRAVRPLSQRTAFELTVSYDDLDAPSDRFAFVAGTRARMRVGFDSRGKRDRWRVGYELEENDRDSASVSPSRDRLVVSYEAGIGSRWTLEGTVSHRQSEYDELVARRSERLDELGATGRRNLGNGWSLALEYRLVDNDSNVPQFSYRSHRVGASIGRSF